MPGKKRFPVIIITLFIILLLDVPCIAQQQPLLEKKVSFSFSGMTLSNVLRAISNKTGVKFSYNPELIQPGRMINEKFNNVPLKAVLSQLLNDPTLSFREIGSQIVVYRGDPSKLPLEPNQQLIQSKPQIVIPAKKIPDTVYVYQLDTLIINRADTIFRSISITHFDTIRITDTVYIEKSRNAQKAGRNLKNRFDKNSVKHKKFLENNGFYSGLYFEMLPGNINYSNSNTESDEYLKLVGKTNAGQLSKYSFGLVAGYDYLKIGFRTGAGYTRLGDKFGYSYTGETGGFYKTDTVEWIYTLPGGDTLWIPITDSTWVPKASKNYSFRNPNTYRYVDIPLSVKFRFWQNETAELYVLGGVNASFLVSSDAIHINSTDFESVVHTKSADLNPVLFAWHAGLGSALKFSSRSGILAEAYYRKQTNNQFKGLPVDKRYGLLGIKLGAYVKF